MQVRRHGARRWALPLDGSTAGAQLDQDQAGFGGLATRCVLCAGIDAMDGPVLHVRTAWDDTRVARGHLVSPRFCLRRAQLRRPQSWGVSPPTAAPFARAWHPARGPPLVADPMAPPRRAASE